MTEDMRNRVRAQTNLLLWFSQPYKTLMEFKGMRTSHLFLNNIATCSTFFKSLSNEEVNWKFSLSSSYFTTIFIFVCLLCKPICFLGYFDVLRILLM